MLKSFGIFLEQIFSRIVFWSRFFKENPLFLDDIVSLHQEPTRTTALLTELLELYPAVSNSFDLYRSSPESGALKCKSEISKTKI